MRDLVVWLLICQEHGEIVITVSPYNEGGNPECPFCGHGTKIYLRKKCEA